MIPSLSSRSLRSAPSTPQVRHLTSVASRTDNPIRKIVERLDAKPNPEKKLIPLSIGDPTVFKNFGPPEFIGDRMAQLFRDGVGGGYGPSSGLEDARESVAKEYSVAGSECTAGDVVMGSGCSHAIDLAIAAILEPGEHNLVVPQPGFPLYETLAKSRGIEVRKYRLDSHKDWEIDLSNLGEKLDRNSVLLLNSPSNPCGSVFSKKHVLEILELCGKKGIRCILSDEIYAKMSFEGEGGEDLPFLNHLHHNVPVPFVHMGGLAKRYMVPGWRLGWLAVHTPQHCDSHIREFNSKLKVALADLSTLILGPSCLHQSLVKPLLEETPSSYHEMNLKNLRENAEVVNRE